MVWVGVDWQRQCKRRQLLGELDNHDTLFFSLLFLAVELDHLCGMENVNSAQGGLSYQVVLTWQGTHEAATQYTQCCLWKWPHQKTNQFIRRCNPYAIQSASKGAVIITSRMRLALHATRPTPHGEISAWCKKKSTWSVTTRRAPSRHC